MQSTRYAFAKRLPKEIRDAAGYARKGYTPVPWAWETRLWRIRATLRYQDWTHQLPIADDQIISL